MIVLGIDTSTMTGGSSLVSDKGIIGEYILNIRTTHSERLLPAIKHILYDADVTLSQIDGFSVVTGPGSFTGLRIGVATAKGFAYSLAKPVIGVNTLETLAWQFMEFPGLVCPLIDARRQEVYTQVFQSNKPVSESKNCSLAEILAFCKERAEQVMFVGDGAVTYREIIKDNFPDALFPSLDKILLRSSSVAALGLAKLRKGDVEDPLQLVPFYMRKSEAEIKWKKATE